MPEEVSKDLPIVFVPDATCLSKEGFLYTKEATVIINEAAYFKMRKAIEIDAKRGKLQRIQTDAGDGDSGKEKETSDIREG